MSSPHGDSDKAACSDVRDAQLVADVQTLEIKGNFGDCRKLKAEVEPVSCKLLPVGREESTAIITKLVCDLHYIGAVYIHNE